MFPSGPNFKEIDIPPNIDTNLVNNLVKKEFYAFVIKSFIALILIAGGLFFIYIGIRSDSNIIINTKIFSLKLNKSFPGITLAILGFLLMFFSKIKIKIKNSK